MEEHRCPGCGRPTGTPGVLCPACCTSGYSQQSGNWQPPSPERLGMTPPSRPPTSEDLKRLERVEQWKREHTSSSEPKTNDSPTDGESQSPWKLKTKKAEKYTLSQVATAAGRAVAAVGADNLPLEAQREALELAKDWLLKLEK